MNIHSNFECGNIIVTKQVDNTVYLKHDMRDSQGDWFYWAFCAEECQGKTVTFSFDSDIIGYYGPAVSYDLVSWHWLEAKDNDHSFTYTFKENEKRVYFAHNMIYTPERFWGFVRDNKIGIDTLCQSKEGRNVPCLKIGKGDKKIIFTSRHHACESTGTYVLEGVIRELIESPSEYEFLIVPFVDYDGVIKGDQGKNRHPHDHNRDYIATPIYNETRAIYEYAKKNNAFIGVDFHSPYHLGGINDKMFFVMNNQEKSHRFHALGDIFAKMCSKETMQYKEKDNFPPNTDWNSDSAPSFANVLNRMESCHLAFSLETAYFGDEENKVSTDKLTKTGRAFYKALMEYLKHI